MRNTKRTSGGQQLRHGYYESPPIHIPDGKGGSYKTELVLFRSEEATEKLLWWYADDPRQQPHNHPWYFESTILEGGYTEDRYRIDDGSADPSHGPIALHSTVTYGVGDVNVVPVDVYHNVRDVMPGTRTHMRCGPAIEGNSWYYLDTATLELTPWEEASSDVPFIDQLRSINPHMRPR